MDLNFSFSPSPTKRHRLNQNQNNEVPSPLKAATAERVKNTARDLLSGALKEAIRKEDDEDAYSEADSISSPVKRIPGMSPFTSPTKTVRRRKRKSLDKSTAFHHTFVMKLFDRSVDLAQFRGSTNYPLYPVCRAWMRNEPANTGLAPRERTPTPEPGSDSDHESDAGDVYKLPPHAPIPADGPSPRIPPAPPVQTGAELDLDLDQTDAPPPALLLSNHLVRWWGVRKAWKQAANENEERYSKSLTVLKEMFEK